MGGLWGGHDEIGTPGLESGGDFLSNAAGCPQPIPSTSLSPETYGLAPVSILEAPFFSQASPHNGYLDFVPAATFDWQSSQTTLSTVTDSLSQFCDVTAQNAFSANIQAEATVMTTNSDPLQLLGSVWPVDNVTTNLGFFWASLDSSSAEISAHTLAERVEIPSDLEALSRQPTAMSSESSSGASTSQMGSPPILVNSSPETQGIDSSGVFKCHKCTKRPARTYDTWKKLHHYHGQKIGCSVPGCESSFNLRSDLKRHLETVMHGGKKSWPCEQCDKSFVRRDGMLKHFKNKHRK
ncbi:hypothetical protein QBC43DRAFT_71795 [Cladorrhinum sp. PSN259]|nr:hypothetical protein QBC43DRAFT_71795 [Cladorrhinum sp. PSN259]